MLFGLALAMPGTYLLIRGFQQKQLGKLAAAASVFALAASTRVTWFPFAGILWIAALFLVWKWTEGSSPVLLLKKWVWALGPPLVVLGLSWYANYVRFDSPFDFGVQWHQNPAVYLYFRNLSSHFSPLTQFWNLVFNLASYYAPPQVVDNLGLYRLSFSYCEGFPQLLFTSTLSFCHWLCFFPWVFTGPRDPRSRLLIPFALLSVVVIQPAGCMAFQPLGHFTLLCGILLLSGFTLPDHPPHANEAMVCRSFVRCDAPHFFPVCGAGAAPSYSVRISKE